MVKVVYCLSDLDKLIGALTQQISSTGLQYSCILTASAPSEVRVTPKFSSVTSTLYASDNRIHVTT